MLNNKNILVTGGTGSFGKKFIETVLKKFNQKKRSKKVTFDKDVDELVGGKIDSAKVIIENIGNREIEKISQSYSDKN